MIIFDLRNVMIASLMAMLGEIKNERLSVELLRHMVLNSIRANRKKFRDYAPSGSDVVIACDQGPSWRKTVFPYYKARRQEAREASPIDWSVVFEALNNIQAELQTYFPYRVVSVDSAEGDDVIGTLARLPKPKAEFTLGDLAMRHETVILSADGDFKQLLAGGVVLYNPIANKGWVRTNNPARDLKEKIARGDRTDGIPNFMSPDDCFVAGGRQRPLAQKKLDVWLDQRPEEFCTDETLRRGWTRNERLIDLSFTPHELKRSIVDKYESEAGKTGHIMDYLMQYRLKQLTESASDF